MRIIKITLAALLVLVGAVYCLTTARKYLSGSSVPPTISCSSDTLEVSVHDEDAVLLAGVTASDKQDGDLTSQIHIQGVSKLLTNDTAKISYIVFDSHGNAASVSRTLRYTDYEKPHFTVKSALVYAENQDIALLDRIGVTDVVDGDITSAVRVSALAPTSDPEVQTVTIQATNSMGDTTQVTLPLVIYSGTMVRPDVNLTEYLVYLDQGGSFSPRSYLSSVSTPIGPGDLNAVQISGSVDTQVPGTYYVYYRYPYNLTAALSVLTVVVE